MRLTKEDKEELKVILERDHLSKNGSSIVKCSETDCFYRKILKMLK